MSRNEKKMKKPGGADGLFTVKVRKRRSDLPGEGLLHKVNIRLRCLIPNSTADVVAQRTAPADHNGHLAHFLIDLHVQQGINIGYEAKLVSAITNTQNDEARNSRLPGNICTVAEGL